MVALSKPGALTKLIAHWYTNCAYLDQPHKAQEPARSLRKRERREKERERESSTALQCLDFSFDTPTCKSAKDCRA